MKMRRGLVVGFVVLCVVVGAAAVFALTPLSGMWFTAGESVKAIEADAAGEDSVIATVNGEPIFKSALERMKILGKVTADANAYLAEKEGWSEEAKALINDVSSDGELLQSLISKSVKMQEAERLGISVSEQEVSDYVDEQDKLMADSSVDPKNSELVKNIVESYSAGLGMTYDEYRDKIESVMARESLMIEKLCDSILESKNIGIDTLSTRKEEVLNEYFDKLLADAVIEIK